MVCCPIPSVQVLEDACGSHCTHNAHRHSPIETWRWARPAPFNIRIATIRCLSPAVPLCPQGKLSLLPCLVSARLPCSAGHPGQSARIAGGETVTTPHGCKAGARDEWRWCVVPHRSFGSCDIRGTRCGTRRNPIWLKTCKVKPLSRHGQPPGTQHAIAKRLTLACSVPENHGGGHDVHHKSITIEPNCITRSEGLLLSCPNEARSQSHSGPKGRATLPGLKHAPQERRSSTHGLLES